MVNKVYVLALLLISFLCRSCMETSQVRSQEPKVRREKIAVPDISESDSVYVKAKWQGLTSRSQELHFCITENSFNVYSDSISLFVFESTNSNKYRPKEMLFDLLVSAVKRKERKRVRKPFEGDSWIAYDLKYYKDSHSLLDTTLYYDIDYQFFSNEVLLLMEELNRMRFYYNSLMDENRDELKRMKQ